MVWDDAAVNLEQKFLNELQSWVGVMTFGVNRLLSRIEPELPVHESLLVHNAAVFNVAALLEVLNLLICRDSGSKEGEISVHGSPVNEASAVRVEVDRHMSDLRLGELPPLLGQGAEEAAESLGAVEL